MHDIVGLPGIAIYDILHHLPIFMVLKKAKPNQTFKDYKIRSMKFFQAKYFIVYLEEQLLSKLDFDNHTSINSQTILLYQTFHAVLEVHAPPCTASRKQKKRLSKPWLTPQTCDFIKRKKMHSKVWNKKDSHEFVIYKQYRNQLSRLIKNAKRDYFEKTIF